MAARTPSEAGKATVAIDFRSQTEPTEKSYWTPLPGVTALLSVLQELFGPDATVIADFGWITISEIDLGQLAERFKAAK